MIINLREVWHLFPFIPFGINSQLVDLRGGGGDWEEQREERKWNNKGKVKDIQGKD